ncbi:unnamed protein product, partial [Phaeothamnion confervicola]
MARGSLNRVRSLDSLNSLGTASTAAPEGLASSKTKARKEGVKDPAGTIGANVAIAKLIGKGPGLEFAAKQAEAKLNDKQGAPGGTAMLHSAPPSETSTSKEEDDPFSTEAERELDEFVRSHVGPASSFATAAATEARKRAQHRAARAKRRLPRSDAPPRVQVVALRTDQP